MAVYTGYHTITHYSLLLLFNTHRTHDMIITSTPTITAAAATTAMMYIMSLLSSEEAIGEDQI